jgi:hypothetical protein
MTTTRTIAKRVGRSATRNHCQPIKWHESARLPRPPTPPGPRPHPATATPTPTTASDRIWAVGTVTLRHAGKLHYIGVGRVHAGTEVLILTQRPAHPDHQQGNRRTPARTDPRPISRLPAHRTATRTHTTNTLTQRGFRVSSMT